jgi:hypothetical protein
LNTKKGKIEKKETFSGTQKWENKNSKKAFI